MMPSDYALRTVISLQVYGTREFISEVSNGQGTTGILGSQYPSFSLL